MEVTARTLFGDSDPEEYGPPLPARRKRRVSEAEAGPEPEGGAAARPEPEPEAEPEGGAAAKVGTGVRTNRVIAEVETDSPETTLDRRLEQLAAADAQHAAEARKNLNEEHTERRRAAQERLDKDLLVIAQSPGPEMSGRLQKRMREADEEEQEDDRKLAIGKAAINQAQGRMPDWPTVADLLRCPVLIQNTADPVRLTCGHTVDRGVARELYAESEGVFPCPVCRTPNTKPIAKTGARRDPLLARLVRALVGKGV